MQKLMLFLFVGFSFSVSAMKQEQVSYSPEKTKEKFKELKAADIGSTEGIKLLKNVIRNGQGPYVALSTDIMCQYVKDRAGGGQALSTQEKYLKYARAASPLIGNYLTLQSNLEYFSALADPFWITDVEVFATHSIAIIKQILESYFVFTRHLNNTNDLEILKNHWREAIEQLNEPLDESMFDSKVELKLAQIYNEFQKERLKNLLENPEEGIRQMLSSKNIFSTGNYAQSIKAEVENRL